MAVFEAVDAVLCYAGPLVQLLLGQFEAEAEGLESVRNDRLGHGRLLLHSQYLIFKIA
jgi:hypothetical protein